MKNRCIISVRGKFKEAVAFASGALISSANYPGITVSVETIVDIIEGNEEEEGSEMDEKTEELLVKAALEGNEAP